jgi:hypothetical protein
MDRTTLENVFHAINHPGDRLTDPDPRYDNTLVDGRVVEGLGIVSFRDTLKINVYENGTFLIMRSVTALDLSTIADFARAHDFLQRLGLKDA